MLPDEHEVWPDGPGKNGESAINQHLTSCITLSPISKAQDRDGVLGATWPKPLILLLFFYKLEMRYSAHLEEDLRNRFLKFPYSSRLENHLFLRYKCLQEERNT